MSDLTNQYDLVTVKNFAFRLSEASGNPVDYYANESPTWTGTPTYEVAGPLYFEPEATAVTLGGATFSFSGFTDWGTVYTNKPTLSLWLKQPVAADAGIFQWYIDADNYIRVWWDNTNNRFELNYRAGGTDWRGWSDPTTISGWTLAMFAFNFTGPGSIPRFGVNGVDALDSYDASGFPVIPAGSATVTVGGDGVHANFQGSISEVVGTNDYSYITVRNKFYRAAVDSPYINLILNSADYLWRFNDADGASLTSIATGWTLAKTGTGQVYENPGPVIGDPLSKAIEFDGTCSFQSGSRVNWMSGASQLTIQYWCKFPVDTDFQWVAFNSTSNWIGVDVIAADQLRYRYQVGGLSKFSINFSPLSGDFSTWRMVTFVWDAGAVNIYIDKDLVSTTGPYSPTTLLSTLMDMDMATYIGLIGRYAGQLADFSIHRGKAFTALEIETAFDLATVQVEVPSENLPMRLQGYLSRGVAQLPMRLLGAASYPQQSLPMSLQGISSSESTEAALYYDVQVVLDGTDISDQVVGQVVVEHQEKTSGLASFQFIPSVGVIDPDAFERKPVTVDYRRVTSSGSLIYASRRFTGISSSSYYDPDTGIIRVEATTDLQGLFENMDKVAIQAAIPNAVWSEHIFEASADGWQYAQDLLSTTPEDCHISENGWLRVVPWAAKATADLELTDSEVIDSQISLTRAKRRDLLTRVRVNMDFRFVRLRHREINVSLPEQPFCTWLNQGFALPGKSMVQSAADSGSWTRVSDIFFNTFPEPGTYCLPPRGWVGGGDEFCLRASWKAARRWAQTVTEEYSLYVFCPDLEESVGRQEINEDYGIEATYDATDYERITGFSGPPTGAVFDAGNSEDWTKEATDSETDGRLAMEDAQRVALAKASTSILDRARRNRLSFEPVYNPFITLSKTLRLNTTYVQAKGKVYQLQETFDTEKGDLRMKVSLALSRHGGSGLAADTPKDPVPEPAPPVETPTPRTYALPWRIGGLIGSQVQNPDWDGFHTNVHPGSQTGPNLYEQKFVVLMPEIEEAARNATSVQAEQHYELVIPEDELTMSY